MKNVSAVFAHVDSIVWTKTKHGDIFKKQNLCLFTGLNLIFGPSCMLL